MGNCFGPSNSKYANEPKAEINVISEHDFRLQVDAIYTKYRKTANDRLEF